MNNENRPQQVPANADGNLRETHDDESALHSDWSGDESTHESLGDGHPSELGAYADLAPEARLALLWVRQLHGARRALPRAHVLWVRSDEMFADFAKVSTRAARFLGLSGTPQLDDLVLAPGDLVRTKVWAEARRVFFITEVMHNSPRDHDPEEAKLVIGHAYVELTTDAELGELVPRQQPAARL